MSNLNKFILIARNFIELDKIRNNLINYCTVIYLISKTSPYLAIETNIDRNQIKSLNFEIEDFGILTYENGINILNYDLALLSEFELAITNNSSTIKLDILLDKMNRIGFDKLSLNEQEMLKQISETL